MNVIWLIHKRCSLTLSFLIISSSMSTSHTLLVSGECTLPGSVLSQQKFEATDIRALSMSQLSDRPCYSSRVLDRPCYSSQISVTVPCYSSILFRKQQENTSSRRGGMPTQKTRRGRERHREKERDREHMSGGERAPALWLLFLYVFFLHPGPALCKLGQPGVLFVLPEVLTVVLGPSFDLPLFYFLAFPFLVFQPPPFWTPVSYSNYLTLATTSAHVYICVSECSIAQSCLTLLYT